MSRDCCVLFPLGAMGSSAVCDCGISWSYSLTFFILSGKSFMKIRKGMVLRPTPRVHRIKQGLDLRLDCLRLLVDCAQGAMSWSINGWTILSHSNRVYVIASFVGPCGRPLRNPWWSNLSVCVPDSSHHPGCWWYRAQTAPAGFHKTSKFGTHADSQQVCYLRLSACWCCSSIYALGFCNRCRLATPVCSSQHRISLLSYRPGIHLRVANHLEQCPELKIHYR